MKKILLFMFIIILVGCGDGEVENKEKAVTKSENSEGNRYGIEKVIVVETDNNLKLNTPMPEESKQFHINSEKFEKELLEYIFSENNISYEYQYMPVYDDALTALINGDADTMIPSSDQSALREDGRFSSIYSHMKSIFTLGADEDISLDYDYNASFPVITSNENFAQMLNDSINKMKENGTYEEIYNSIFDTNKYSALK